MAGQGFGENFGQIVCDAEGLGSELRGLVTDAARVIL
jgi:hypothetical protein